MSLLLPLPLPLPLPVVHGNPVRRAEPATHAKRDGYGMRVTAAERHSDTASAWVWG